MVPDMSDLFADKNERAQYLEEYRRHADIEGSRLASSYMFITSGQGKWLHLDSFDTFVLSLCVLWLIYLLYIVLTTYRFKYQRYRLLLDRAQSSHNTANHIELQVIKPRNQRA